MKNLITPLLFVSFSVLLCCSPAKEENKEPVTVESDTLDIARVLLYGLWSMDSANSLINEGFYFKNDGSVDFVSSESSAEWELKGADTLKLKWDEFYEKHEAKYHIDSLSDSRMVLSDSDGVYVFRKVPFGLNHEGMVVQGFSGYIDVGKTKEFSFELPPARKIALKMACPDSSVTFRLFDDQQKEITSTNVRNWAGIVIRSGKYKLVLSKEAKSPWMEEADYDIKVLVY